MRKVFASILLLVFSVNSFATCILLIVTSKSIILASDTRYFNKNSVSGKTSSHNDAKICQAGAFYFTYTGTASCDKLPTYDPLSVIGKYLKGMRDFDIIKIRQLKVLLSNQRKLIQDYKKNHRNETVPTGDFCFIMVGFKNGLPAAYSYKKGYDSVNRKKFDTDTFYTKAATGTLTIYSFGVTEDITNFMNKDKSRISGPEGIKNRIYQLMDIAIKQEPNYVAYPIDILQLADQNYSWVARNFPIKSY